MMLTEPCYNEAKVQKKSYLRSASLSFDHRLRQHLYLVLLRLDDFEKSRDCVWTLLKSRIINLGGGLLSVSYFDAGINTTRKR